MKNQTNTKNELDLFLENSIDKKNALKKIIEKLKENEKINSKSI